MSSQNSLYERRDCSDGSTTYYNAEVDECYHSPIGATLEAKEKYVGGIDWDAYAMNNEIVILDICYGMGYNSAAAIDLITEKFPEKKIHIIALENDPEIVKMGLGELRDFTSAKILKRLMQEPVVKEGNIRIKLIIEDAKQVVKRLDFTVDVVFFDPFSPKKAPHMWTEEFFQDIYNICAQGAQLITYSCARIVRDRMRAVGFIVKDGPVVGRRGPATHGTKGS